METPSPTHLSSQAWHTHCPDRVLSPLTQSSWLLFLRPHLRKRKMVLLDSALWLLGAWRSRCGLRASSSPGCSFSASSKMNRVWRQCSCIFLIWSVSFSCAEYGELLGSNERHLLAPRALGRCWFPQGVYNGSPGAGFHHRTTNLNLWGWS